MLGHCLTYFEGLGRACLEAHGEFSKSVITRVMIGVIPFMVLITSYNSGYNLLTKK